MRTELEKKIERPFDIAPIQYHTDNKNLITVQNILKNGADSFGSPYGFIVGAHDGLPIYLDVEAHLVTIGKTGSGKGVSTAISNLVSHAGSALSLEIGGATFKKTYNYRKHVLRQNIYLFDPHDVIGLGSSNYNPMDDLDPTEPDFYSRVLTMASALTSDSEGNKEQNPYFRENPRALITAMIIYLKLADPSVISDDQKNFVYLAKIFSNFPTEAWHKHISALQQWDGKYKVLLNQLGNYLGTAQTGDQNARSVISSTAQWLVKWAADDALGKHMISSDFSMRDLRDKKTSIYIVMKSVDDYITYQPWLRLILQSAIDNTPNKGDGGKNYQQEDRILFMIDELTQLGHLQAVATGAQTVRQKGIVFWSMFQDYASLIKVYGEEQASAFVGASDVVQIFRNHEDMTLEHISKHLGRYMVYVPTVSEGQGLQVSIGMQESVAHATAEQKTWQLTKSEMHGITAQKTISSATTFTDMWSNTNSPNGNSVSTGGSIAQTYGRANAQGESKQSGTTEAEGGGTTESDTKQKGIANNEGWNTNYTLSYQPIVIESVDFREIKEHLSGNKQILFVDSNAGSHCALDDQARYYQIPFLKDRADGLPIPEIPAFPDPPRKTNVQLKPLPPVSLEDFKLNDSDLHWEPENLVAWKPPTELSEWGQGVKETREAYEAARYRFDLVDKRPGFFQGFFRSPLVGAGSVAGVATTTYVGGHIAIAGATFGALMLTGTIATSWRRYKLYREKMKRWKTYTNMRGAAMEVIRDQLAPIMATHDVNNGLMDETVMRQNELVSKNGSMETALSNRHDLMKDLLESHRENLARSHQMFQEIRSGTVSGWSSGDWMHYIKKLRTYHRVREKFFDFDKGAYLPAPVLAAPSRLDLPPPRTLSSKTAPMPEMFEAAPLDPKTWQESSALPKKGWEVRKQIHAYFDTPLTGYDLPDDIKTVNDAITRRSELAGSKNKRHRKQVMQMDAALESMDDPVLDKFDSLVRGYATGLRYDEDDYAQLLRQQIREGQDNVRETIGKIRQFNGQVRRVNEARAGFAGFARRLDEARAHAHHRAHARAIRDMDSMEQTFSDQSDLHKAKGPLVPLRPPKVYPALTAAQPSK